MKLMHGIKIEVFGKDLEDNKINDAFDFLLPFDLLQNKVKIETEYFGPDPEIGIGEPITSYKTLITQQRLLTEFISFLRKMLSPSQKEDIVTNASKFMDEDCNAYIRFDKESLFKKELELTKGGNCFHVTISLAAYPKTIEKAREVVTQLFQ
ncbi:hypothetical protein JXM83_02835 [Candidatus Woesearchaeota archaeon]|nr:hypothetical protein [Candidatus Woesearchaeota archaeon]